MHDRFLNQDELATLTGIKKGRGGKTREQLQVQQLRAMGIAFRINARGAPVVTWGAVNGVNLAPEPAAWQPRLLSMSP